MPPEYLSTGRVSAKTDTYALGMFIIVILTNKKFTPKDSDFVYEFRDAVANGWPALKEMLDPAAGTCVEMCLLFECGHHLTVHL
jgi:hypothetical protein